MMLPSDNIQKTNVTLKMLVDSKILYEGQEIFCPNPEINGFINRDGTITVNHKGIQKIFDYLSGAARYIEKRSLNGWIYWNVIINGERRPIGSFRDLYIKTQEDSKGD